jgi:hypothetical protein
LLGVAAAHMQIMVKLSILQVNPMKVEEYLKIIADKYGVAFTPRDHGAVDEVMSPVLHLL